MNWPFEIMMAFGPRSDWFSGHVLRLIAKADMYNREQLRLAFPEHVAAYERWMNREGEFADQPTEEVEQGPRYFLAFRGIPGAEIEVTKAQWVSMESRMMARPSSVHKDEPATAGFNAGGVRGTIRTAAIEKGSQAGDSPSRVTGKG